LVIILIVIFIVILLPILILTLQVIIVVIIALFGLHGVRFELIGHFLKNNLNLILKSLTILESHLIPQDNFLHDSKNANQLHMLMIMMLSPFLGIKQIFPFNGFLKYSRFNNGCNHKKQLPNI
jgi:hypothetical protein